MTIQPRRAQEWIDTLQLTPHPEGGWYRESYRAALEIPAAALPAIFDGPRNCCTSIYFLLEAGECSALHRIRQDEIWHFHAGGALGVDAITADGDPSRQRLGLNPAAGQSPQCVVPAGAWFGAEVATGDFSLVGCTVAPGFDFADFEMADREQLLRRYPEHRAVIRKLTR